MRATQTGKESEKEGMWAQEQEARTAKKGIEASGHEEECLGAELLRR